ncbi:MAG: hypothetical protein AB1351_09955 [Thermoproteota archaeon]
MGHKGSIEAKYTTNKGKLPEALVKEMRDNFERSQEFLDLEKAETDPLEKAKREALARMSLLLENSKTPEELARVQELIGQALVSGNAKASSNSSQDSESSQQRKPSGSLELTGGNTLAPCLIVRSSLGNSKDSR